LGVPGPNDIYYAFKTNSDYMTEKTILKTDLCKLGLDMNVRDVLKQL